MNKEQKQQLLNAVYQHLKTQTGFLGAPLNGGEIEELFPQDLLRVREGEHETVVLVMKSGEYTHIPHIQDPSAYFKSLGPDIVQINDGQAVNMINVTKVDSATREVWAGDVKLQVSQEYWKNFIEEYKSRQ
ncbi:hypothetical protein [Paenibacillus sp. NRS-1780]|uniref:hypothetical protein n=1 Tax=Paenibacillus sp. NRS-1780 TaxID=3233904 RepID=UPI003D2ACE1D